MTAETPQNSTLPDGIGPWLQWAGVSLVGLTALVLLAAQAPPRVRLLGLFAVLLGMVCGWGLGVLAGQFAIHRSGKVVTVFVCLLIASAEVGLMLETWRKYLDVQQENYDVAVREHNKLVFSQSRNVFQPEPKWTDSQTAKLRELFDEAQTERQKVLQEQKQQLDDEFEASSRFPCFLNARISELAKRFDEDADLPDVAGIGFWLVEIALGVAGGLFLFRQTVAENRSA